MCCLLMVLVEGTGEPDPIGLLLLNHDGVLEEVIPVGALGLDPFVHADHCGELWRNAWYSSSVPGY